MSELATQAKHIDDIREALKDPDLTPMAISYLRQMLMQASARFEGLKLTAERETASSASRKRRDDRE